ncbi:MAG: radical SAM protein [Desulfobacterales bacterium]|nr:radical SAM protein [Desulfobacterales bacterium]
MKILSCYVNEMAITVNRVEVSPFRKLNSPIRKIHYSGVRTRDYEFHFNLKGEIKMIRGLGMNWPHPYNWLKRSDGNDWVYYRTGNVAKRQVLKFFGEYYLPCLSYQSNQIFEFNPYTDPAVAAALAAWSQLYANLYGTNTDDLKPEIRDFIKSVIKNGEDVLHQNAKDFHEITGGRISVLPPDARHVNYDVVPVMISEGCIYNCKFCYVKSKKKFNSFSKDKITTQIDALKSFYGENIINYSGLFLGNHDGLFAEFETIEMAANASYKEFGFEKHSVRPAMFLFGSVESFLRSDTKTLEGLNNLPYHTYINIGLESFDKETLDLLGKPLSPSLNKEVFEKMVEVNRNYENIEITANILLSEDFSENHNNSVIEMLNSVKEKTNKGGVYFSPMVNNLDRVKSLDTFFDIKNQVSYPAFTYLIQRL